jgi:predicted dehydrogenase
MSKNKMSRRKFIQTSMATAAAGLAGTGIAETISETRSEVTPDKAVNFGLIGCGGKGRQHLGWIVEREKTRRDVNVVALCDVYEGNKRKAQEIAPNARMYHNYKDLLNHSGLDCVLIATPDHWHAQMAIDALEKGMDVFLEKPMTQTIEEARAVVRAQEKSGKIVQLGGSGPSSDYVWKARKLIEEGLIGKVVWSMSGRARNTIEGEWNGNIPENAEKETDWDLWLGPAPKRPYDADRQFRWRKYWDYGTGLIGDLYYHSLCPMVLMTGAELPIRVTGSGGMFFKTQRETPDTFTMVADYPGMHHILLTGSMANSYPVPQTIRGYKGTLEIDGNNIAIYPEEIFDDYKAQFVDRKYDVQKFVVPIRDGYRHRSAGYGGWLPTPEADMPEPSRTSLTHNFLDCVISREEPYYPARLGYMIQVAISLAVESYRKNKVMQFDPDTEKIV